MVFVIHSIQLSTKKDSQKRYESSDQNSKSFRIKRFTFWQKNKSIYYPLRTSTHGVYSGFRIQMNTAINSSMNIEWNGVIVVVSDPFELPNKGQFIPRGTITSIVIKPTLSYRTADVNKLAPIQRQCMNDYESATILGLKYMKTNCYFECRSKYIQKFCNCSSYIHHPIGISLI